ncbi:unnamed protein product [Ixodes hexagonus]
MLCCAFILVAPTAALLLLFLWVRKVKSESHRTFPGGQPIWGFFHPYCNAGGGGERVLWAAIRSVQERYPDHHCVVYTGDTDVTSDKIIDNAAKRFNIKLRKSSVHFIFLRHRNLVEAKPYPFLTILGQSMGSMILGLEALFKFVPTIYVDTMGYAFTLPIFKALGRCQVACYVHYPTISTDMLARVAERSTSHNNRSAISRSQFLTSAKLVYYGAFAYLYKLCGRCADVIMVNSSWTRGHIVELWKVPQRTFLVYPPCNIEEFKTIKRTADDPTRKEFRVLSIAQFRPEKDHKLQLLVFHRLKSELAEAEFSKVKLVLVGSCRNREDEERVESLKDLTAKLDLEANVEFKLNVPFEELELEMEHASAAIHTMWNEHFGIGVVECMAAGLVMVAHDSGGPRLDIVTEYNGRQTGFLASDADSYANVLKTLLTMPSAERLSIQMNGRLSSERFSDEVFNKLFLDVMEPMVSNTEL